MDERLKRKLQEITGVLSILLGVFLLLVLVSHTIWDSSPFTYSSREVRNWGGIVGAHLSDVLFQVIGIASFIIPAALVVFGMNRIMGRKGYRVKAVGVVLLVLSITFLANLLENSFHFGLGRNLTGTLGMAFSKLFTLLLSIPGAYIVSLSLLLSSVILLIPVTIESLVDRLKERDARKTGTSSRRQRDEEEPEDAIIPEPFMIEEPEKPRKPSPHAVPEILRRSVGSYTFPPPELLSSYDAEAGKPDRESLKRLGDAIKKSLEDFDVEGTIPNVHAGPVVTLVEYEPIAGIKMNKIISLSEDLGRALGGRAVRVSRIPHKTSIGIEVPNTSRGIVGLKEILSCDAFIKSPSRLTVAVGVNINGKPVVADLAKMPHLLVAGTTGSGKSVCLNSMIMSVLYKATPDEVKMLMVDPKMIELSAYENIPHLLHPVVTNPKEATEGLKKMVFEMERRYRLIAEQGAKNIESYNRTAADGQKLPYILVIIDELADLMYTASSEAEAAIVRLAQMARASGIHMIIATQRPSVDVITGIIKANFPIRIAFRVTSKIDSRTILDTNGAEQLLDKGDMLMLSVGAAIERLHGAFISEEEIKRVTDFIRAQQTPDFTLFHSIEADMATVEQQEGDEVKDDLYQSIISYAEAMGEISISSIQRKFKIGYNRAARIMDMMEEDGMVGPPRGAGKPRDFIKKRTY
ncbi:MAG: DNA translocase FtsK 4TM domain-containing protein [bacterium]